MQVSLSWPQNDRPSTDPALTHCNNVISPKKLNKVGLMVL